MIEDPHARRGPRDEEDEGERTDEELEETFPSSDPPARAARGSERGIGEQPDPLGIIRSVDTPSDR